MSGRIEPNRALPPVTMSARLLNALCEHARETHPEECCGLLVGDAPGEPAHANATFIEVSSSGETTVDQIDIPLA